MGNKSLYMTEYSTLKTCLLSKVSYHSALRFRPGMETRGGLEPSYGLSWPLGLSEWVVSEDTRGSASRNSAVVRGSQFLSSRRPLEEPGWGSAAGVCNGSGHLMLVSETCLCNVGRPKQRPIFFSHSKAKPPDSAGRGVSSPEAWSGRGTQLLKLCSRWSLASAPAFPLSAAGPVLLETQIVLVVSLPPAFTWASSGRAKPVTPVN